MPVPPPAAAPPAPSAPAPPAPPLAPVVRRRRWPALAGWAAAGWLAAGLAQAARVDWVLPIIAVVALAGLLRGGRGPVARVVLAVALLYAGTCLAGVLFSVWPWHLAPVPVAGTGFTVLALAYGLTGRRFAIPRLLPGDLPILGGASVVALVALWPLARRGPGARLAIFMHVEDFLRHLLMYDAIRASGGYLFLNQSTALAVTGGSGYFTYPTGGHFVFALAENFLRSGTEAGTAGAWAGDFVWLFAASYVWLGLGVLWAVRHVAGPAAAGWRSVPIAALVTALVAAGPPIRILDRGYPQETTALALVAVLVALLVRPVARTREQIVLVGALLAAVSLNYYLFLPVVGVFAAGWLVLYRRRLLRHPWTLAVTTVLAVPGMLLIPALNWRYAPPAGVLLAGGQVAPVPVPAIVALVCLALAAVVAQAVRGRGPVGRVGVVGLAVTVAAVLGLAAYQVARGGSDYYDVKLQHQLMIVALVLCGGWALLLGPTGRWLRARLPVLSRPRVAGAALVALALLGMAGYAGLGPRAYAPGYAYAHGVTSERPAAGKYAYRLYAAHPRADGTVTLLADDDPWVTYYATVYLGIFQHAYPAQYALAYPLRPWVPPGGALDAVEATIAASRVPVRVYAVDPATRRTLAAFATTLPAGHLTVLDAATLPR